MTTEESTATNEENLIVEEKGEKKGTLKLPKDEEKNLEEIYKNGLHATKKENKALKEQLAKYEAEKKEANDKKLAEEGRYKELLEAKEKELADLNSNIEKERATRKKDNLLNKIRLKAQENGANDVDDITKFLNIDELIDSDDEAINEKLNQLQEKKSYLFGNKKKSATDENNIDFRGSENPKKSLFSGF
jgi:hypothetical protein